jgi:hypothetical protein
MQLQLQQQQQQSVSSTPKPKMPLAPKPKAAPPIPREEKQLAIVLKEEDIRRQMWDAGNSAAATTEKRRIAELAKLASPTPRPFVNDEDQSLTYIRFPIFLTLFIFAFCLRSPIYKSIRSHLLKYNKDLEIRRNISHELYSIGVKEEVRHNLQLQHSQHTQHPLIRSRTNLSKGELSV